METTDMMDAAQEGSEGLDPAQMARKNQEQLAAFEQQVAKWRKEAVSGRRNSGLEQMWAEDQEAYEGVDEATRGSSDYIKGASPSDTLRTAASARSTTRSKVVMNITRPYVDAAAARVQDMLLPTRDRNFLIEPTPIPDLGRLVSGEVPSELLQAGVDPDKARRFAEEQMREAKRKAERAQKQIDDWLVDSRWNTEVAKVIEDAARLGVGVLCGPVPTKIKHSKAKKTDLGMELTYEEVIQPTSRRVDPWNFFPDPTCGEDIHNGRYVFERAYMTKRQLADLIGVPGYNDTQIRKALEEGPSRVVAEGYKSREDIGESERFEVWTFYGFVTRDELELTGVEAELLDAMDKAIVPAMLVTVNDRIIKAALNPLDTGEFPYDVFVWQRIQGSWAGKGVARQIRSPQRIINAATRNMMDNAALSSGPQIIVDKRGIVPADKTWELTPRKIWFATDELGTGQVSAGISAINIPTMQNELQAIIQYALKMAEDVTGMPLILQGQQGSAPETVGGMTLLHNNATTVLRRLARNFDDQIIIPHIRRYYQWLMLYSDNDDAKGDFTIQARGSTALLEKDVEAQALVQLSQFAMDPRFGVKPREWFREMIKTQGLDPDKFMMTDEEYAQLQQQQAEQPQMPPQVMAAQIRTQADLQREQMRLQLEAEKLRIQDENQKLRIRTDMDRDTAYVTSQIRRDQATYEAKMRELELKRELAMLEYAMQHKITLEETKAKLASDAMKLRVQKELAAKDAPGQVVPPPTEPPGKAPTGHAYEK